MNEIDIGRLLARAEGLLVAALKEDQVTDQWRKEAKTLLKQSDEHFGDQLNQNVYPELFKEKS